MVSASQIESMFIYFLLACEKGYTGPNCEIKCHFPFYGFHCQMKCNCIDRYCDPVNGCKQSTTGMQMFLSEIYSTLFYLYTNVCTVLYPSLISRNRITSSLGLDWNSKMVTTDLLESEDGVAKSKIDFRSIQCTYN